MPQFLDAPVAEVKAHWPEDAVEVSVEGGTAWLLDGVAGAGAVTGVTRLLGPYDLLMQGRDRDLLVPDTSRHHGLWPTLGRPGAVLDGGEIVGTWRPRAAGQALTVRLQLWHPVPAATRTRIDAEAERLALHRGVQLSAVIEE